LEEIDVVPPAAMRYIINNQDLLWGLVWGEVASWIIEPKAFIFFENLIMQTALKGLYKKGIRKPVFSKLPAKMSERYKLLNDNTLLIGANLFYDHELDYDHQRASVGIEAISSVGSLRLNQYYGLSNKKKGLNDVNEEALDGQDIEVGAPLPYLPWTNFSYRSFDVGVR
jgi:hypothetical protein